MYLARRKAEAMPMIKPPMLISDKDLSISRRRKEVLRKWTNMLVKRCERIPDLYRGRSEKLTRMKRVKPDLSNSDKSLNLIRRTHLLTTIEEIVSLHQDLRPMRFPIITRPLSSIQIA